MSNLGTAIDLAIRAHDGQVDKLGAPYIQHPMAVMVLVRTEDEKIVAVLHDVVEDTGVTLAELRAAGFSKTVVDAIDALTKRKNEPLEDSIARVVADPSGLARTVKRADVAHNANPERQAGLDEMTRLRLTKKYRRTAELLGTTLEEILDSHQGSPYRV